MPLIVGRYFISFVLSVPSVGMTALNIFLLRYVINANKNGIAKMYVMDSLRIASFRTIAKSWWKIAKIVPAIVATFKPRITWLLLNMTDSAIGFLTLLPSSTIDPNFPADQRTGLPVITRVIMNDHEKH